VIFFSGVICLCGFASGDFVPSSRMLIYFTLAP
jgi:hypothetical protein